MHEMHASQLSYIGLISGVWCLVLDVPVAVKYWYIESVESQKQNRKPATVAVGRTALLQTNFLARK